MNLVTIPLSLAKAVFDAEDLFLEDVGSAFGADWKGDPLAEAIAALRKAVEQSPAPQAEEVACCPICDEPFRPSDVCADDITEGTCHAACLEGSPVVDMETEEEIPGGEVTTYLYREVIEPADCAEERVSP